MPGAEPYWLTLTFDKVFLKAGIGQTMRHLRPLMLLLAVITLIGLLLAVRPHEVAEALKEVDLYLLGLAALVQVCAALPANYVAFEYPVGRPEWWYDIVDGLPDPIVVDSHIEVWDRPGMGVTFRVDAARKYLSEGDEAFFD